MSSPPHKAGRPLTVAGLRVILVTFSVFIALVLGAAYWFAPQLEPIAADLHETLLSVLGAIAVANIAMVWIMRSRSRAVWQAQLEAAPYVPGGPVPPAFGSVVVIGAALCEGLGLFGAALYLLTHQPVALGFGVLSIVFIVLQLPKESQLQPNLREDH